jgi:hypothetical protein
MTLDGEQASNIPSRSETQRQQKPVISPRSNTAVWLARPKSWSFWFFVQIIGFWCKARRTQVRLTGRKF